MGYTASSFSAGQQPTTNQWNVLWANDASFNDGTGIGNNAIAARSLATNAITLACIQITSSFSTSSATPVQVTGLSAPVTIPAGGRNVRLTAYPAYISCSSANNFQSLSIWDGVVGSGTQLALAQESTNNVANHMVQPIAMAIVTPAAGSKTYNVGLSTTGGTSTMQASSTTPSFLLVEAI